MALLRKIQMLLVLSIFLTAATAFTLANSGYPMEGGNPGRNFKVDRPVLCSSISNGKSTVLNTIWDWPPSDTTHLVLTHQLSMDDQGFIYVLTDNLGQVRMYRIVGADGTYNSMIYHITTEYALPTHLNDGTFVKSFSGYTLIMGGSTFNVVGNISQPQSISSGSYAPYKDRWMVRANLDYPLTTADEAVIYALDPNQVLDATPPAINVDLSLPRQALVYKSDTTEFPIVLSGPYVVNVDPSVVASPTFTRQLSVNMLNAHLVDNEVIITANQYDLAGSAFIKLDAVTGAINLWKNISTWEGQTFQLGAGLIYHNQKSFTPISVAGKTKYVDLMNDQTIAVPSHNFLQQPMFSNDDNTVMVFGSKPTGEFELIGYNWDTWGVNMKGRLPDNVQNGDVQFGMPIIGDSCRVHVAINHRIYTLAPLPIQDVVPILECIDPVTRVGYFSYNNRMSKSFIIPQLVDRNNMAPDNVAPIESFAVGRGPFYPFAARHVLNTSDSYTWQLEDYVLSFTVGPALYCPTTLTIRLILTGDSPFPAGFNQVVRDAFVNVTGVSDSRVTLVAKRRSVTQTDTLETELEVGPDPTNQEPTPAEVVDTFVNGQVNDFNQQVSVADGAPSGISTEVSGKGLSNSVEGQIPPPVSAPVQQPQSQGPTDVPQATSSAMKIMGGAMFSVATLHFLLF